MSDLIHNILHIDQALKGLVDSYGVWVYAILFAIVFCETGLVITPFLPGDSLLFAVGALGGSGVLRAEVAAPLLLLAAVLGNTSNYWIGRYIGPKVFSHAPEDARSFFDRLLNRKHLLKAHQFFEKHGGKAISLGQFVPIVRTFCPFVAGAGSMNYGRFIFFNVVGAIAWVGVCTGAGYVFGNIPWVKHNFSVVVLGVVAVSLIPLIIEFVKHKLNPEQHVSPVAATLEPRKSDAA
ncbi:MAG: DedA family protein [Planctomycetes bacterium]|nr:DedA family protein [Planctomycetota bacterium]